MMKEIYAVFAMLSVATAGAQIYGCTDPQSLNYNPSATVNDGSYSYASSSAVPVTIASLPAQLNETSGLIWWNNALLTHNDNDDSNLYALNSQGAITATYPLGSQNTDWEEISQDDQFVYIGDFGNNVSGNRTNLHILRVSKQSLFAQDPVVETIAFAYEDQTDLMPLGPNTTNFDCEAFVVSADFIYLFTKEWTSKRSTIYKLPKVPGTHTAVKLQSFNVNGLITGATFDEQKNIAALSGYNSLLQPFILLLYDFEGDAFFSGNKRKVNLPLPLHQVEGLTSDDGLHYYFSNEKFSQGSFINVPAKLSTVDLSTYLEPFLANMQLGIHGVAPSQKPLMARYDAYGRHIVVKADTEFSGRAFCLYDYGGRNVMTGYLDAELTEIPVDGLAKGAYQLHVGMGKTNTISVLIF